MAITIVNTPEDVSLVKNEAKLVVSTDNYYSTPGEKSTIRLNFSGSCPLNTEQFVLTYTDEDGVAHSFTYTFKTSPSGMYEIATKGVGVAVDDYVGIVNLKLLENFYLVRDFNFTVTGSLDHLTGNILIEGKKTGVCDISGSSETCTDMTMNDANHPVVAVPRENFKILVELYIFDSTQGHVNICTLKGVPNSSDQCTFYLEKYLRGWLQSDIPAFSLSTISWCSKVMREFYMFLSEYYGDPPTAQGYERNPASVSSFYKVLLGGLKTPEFAEGNFMSSYIEATANKFLTKMPTNSSVYTNQKQFLYWYCTAASFTYKLKLYYTDGTTTTHTITSVATDHTGEIAILAAGYTQLDIATLKTAGKTVQKYDVWLINGGSTIISEVRTFYPEPILPFAMKYFMFRNRLGAMETIACQGTSQTKLNVERETIEKSDGVDTSTIVYGQMIDDVRRSVQGANKATGWLKRSEIDYLEEFFDSAEIYEITSSQFVRTVMTDSDYDLGADDIGGKELFGFVFKYNYASKNPV